MSRNQTAQNRHSHVSVPPGLLDKISLFLGNLDPDTEFDLCTTCVHHSKMLRLYGKWKLFWYDAALHDNTST